MYRSHPFAKKEWYNVLVPGFDKRVATLMPCNKTQGQVQASENLRHRVINISLDDCNNIQKKEQMNQWRKLKFQVDEIKGFDCYTNFHGMDITRDHGCAMIKKWHSLIESFVQAKTTDGYIVRMFAIAFTKKTPRQVKATCYAKASKKKLIRQKMMEIMTSTIQKSSLRDLVNILIKGDVGRQIQKECSTKIFPLQENSCIVRKVKILKKPRFDLTKLMELYKEKPEDKKATPAAENAMSKPAE
jgi:small subunit ribosomal protein S3Ae